MGIIARQGIKNNIITYFGVFIGFVNILILQPLVLSPDEFGLLRLLYSVSALFVSIYPIGLNSFTIKYFPYLRDQKGGHSGYPGFLLLATTLLFCLGSVVLYLFKPFFLSKYPSGSLFIQEFNYIFPMSFFLGIFTALVTYCSVIYKTTVPSFLNEILVRILIIISLSLYYIKWISFDTVVIIYVFSYALLVAILLVYIRFSDFLNFKIKWSSFRALPKRAALKFTLLMCITTLASISLRNIDAVFIGSYRNLADVAVYTIAITIASMIDVPANALSKIVIPKLSEAFKNDNMLFIKDVYYKSNTICLWTGAFLFCLVYVNAFDILNILPKKYSEGEWVLKIIAVGGLVNTASGLNVILLQYSHKYHIGTIFLISLALLSALSDILLIPLYGLEGAALGTTISLILLNLVLVFYIKRHFKFQPFTFSDGLILLVTIIIALTNGVFPKIENSIASILIKSSLIAAIFLLIGLKLEIKKLFNTSLLKK
jgi:O-antigen/teichoic acid export membrane protein